MSRLALAETYKWLEDPVGNEAIGPLFGNARWCFFWVLWLPLVSCILFRGGRGVVEIRGRSMARAHLEKASSRMPEKP